MAMTMAMTAVPLSLILYLISAGNAVEFCHQQPNCSLSGVDPVIRQPFSLLSRCAYSQDFLLTCSDNHTTIIELPNSVKLTVTYIDYQKRTMTVHDPTCFLQHLPSLNLSNTPYQISKSNQYYYPNITFFNCNIKKNHYFSQSPTCLGGGNVYAFESYQSLFGLNEGSCKKMYTNSSIPFRILYNRDLILSWSIPDNCCMFNGIPKSHTTDLLRGLFLLFVITIAAYCVIVTIKNKKDDQKKVEKFLEEYRAFKQARYTYADIKKITSKFKYKIGEGGYGKVYKGKLSSNVHVAVKILNNAKGNGDDFINEVKTIGRIHHINVVRLVGFCSDGFKRALVYEFLPNHSLDKYISCDKDKQALGWVKLESIALGVAKGIEYLHQGCDQRILHFDIKPNNILLDQNFHPKIADFGLAKLCSKDQSAVSMTVARGTVGYIAPEVFSRNFGQVSYKSDVYSFGMLLLEMVGVRNKNKEQNTSEVYFPDWIYSRIDHGEELGIELDEGDEDEKRITKKLTIVGLWCIQWGPMDRPSMKVVEQMLEGDGSGLSVPPNSFASKKPSIMESFMGETTSSYTQSLDVIVECE